MVRRFIFVLAAVVAMAFPLTADAQFNLNRGLKAVSKAAQALTLSDADMAQYVREYIDWMDKNNPVTAADNPYTKRLDSITAGMTSVEGTPLNFKVYDVVDVNAFACPDGSIRVFSSLMDIMTDDELLGVIGHEIGHIAKKHSKSSMKQALLTSALKDAVASSSNKVATLTDSQLGALGESLASAKYSRKHEDEADDYGYEFLKSHGKNPLAMALAFKKLQQMEQEAGASKTSKINQLFSTHPELDKRIERMEKRAAKDGL